MANLGQAYVQIIPSAQGIQGKLQSALNPHMAPAGTSAGSKLGTALASAAKKIIATAGLGVAIKKSIAEGAKVEQSLGGIETMFKGSSDKMVQYANQAYKTAGMSANTYMEQATSFSASLLQSVGGDTEVAANLANQALIDMSDNSNKFGTDMERITDAFQGFSKQNYTMLDNLKLGYGGTKTEMERLLADAEKLSGTHYDISNLSDVYSAIHVIQEEMGVSGTTAKEASETFSGSLNQMKGAFSNFLSVMSLGDQATMSLQTALQNLLSSTVTFIFNNALPMVGNVVIQIPTAVFTLLESANMTKMTEFVSKAFSSLGNLLNNKLPQMVTHGLRAVTKFALGLIQAIPRVLNSATRLVDSLGKGLNGNFGKILKAGIKAVGQLVVGLIRATPQIVSSAFKLVSSLASAIIRNLPKIVSTGLKIIVKLAGTLIQNLPKMLSAGSKILSSLVTGIKNALKGVATDMLSVGKNLVKGIWDGINGALDWIKGKIKSWVGNVTEFLKNLFGIHSPSTLMRDEVGTYLAQGIGLGFEDEMQSVEKKMGKAIPSSFNVAPALTYTADSSISSEFMIHNVTTLDGKVIAEETFPVTEKLFARKISMAGGGIL